MTDFFKDIRQSSPMPVPTASNEFAFRHYNPDEMVMGKRMEDHLRFAVAYWHSFAWPGGDPFGGQTFDRPWFGDTMDLREAQGRCRLRDVLALGAPFFCFHDADVRPEGARALPRARRISNEIVDYFGGRWRRPASSFCGARPTCFPTAGSCRARRPIPIRTSSPSPRRR
jgi:xylose isomerase